MNKTPTEAKLFAGHIASSVGNEKEIDIIVCPPAIDLPFVSEVLKDTSVMIGAQNVHEEKSGAFTGEISLNMLKDLEITHVIIGHSERRHVFGESNSRINKKLVATISEGLIPIFCVGETLEEREMGLTNNVLEWQIRKGLKDIDKSAVERMLIAYEPVWAIGTGKVAKPEQADAAMGYIRKLLGEIYDEGLSNKIRLLYGGSIKPNNMDSLIKMPNIDGGLIGGASLKDSFMELVSIAKKYI
ncbi:MAG: triose-phosphate isomerase [Kosmotogaceae bacterium]|jgi:triosephosphate isomerase